jgi:hypothetical protein
MACTIPDTLNTMLRGELSAAETYQQALTKLKDTRAADELRRIHADHRQAATTLDWHVRQHGGQPARDSGAWGTFAKAVEGTACYSNEKFEQNHLAGAISFEEFEMLADRVPKDREIIFYCA